MFDSGLFIGWGEANPGRDEHALHAFSDMVTFGPLIERFEHEVGAFA